jgi:hypothetical protein
MDGETSWRGLWLSIQSADSPSFRVFTAAAAAVLAASFPVPGRPALAESTNRLIVQICLAHADIEAKLLSDFGEKKLGLGISGDGNLLEIFVAPTGTFSVVKTSPRGVSCIVDFGESWQTLQPLEVTRRSGHELRIEPTSF